MNDIDARIYWKKEAKKWKNIANLKNKYTIVLDKWEDTPQKLVKEDEEVISFKIKAKLLSHERKRGIKSNPYDYNLSVKAKSKTFYYNYKYVLRYNFLSRFGVYSCKQIVNFLLWHISNKNKWIIGLKLLASVGTTSQLWSLISQNGFTYNGLMLIVELVIGII